MDRPRYPGPAATAALAAFGAADDSRYSGGAKRAAAAL